MKLAINKTVSVSVELSNLNEKGHGTVRFHVIHDISLLTNFKGYFCKHRLFPLHVLLLNLYCLASPVTSVQ